MKSFSLIILCAVIFTTDTVSADQYVVENSVLHDIKRSPSQHYGRVLAFEGVVTNLFTGLGTKLFIEIGHESKLEPLMVNLLFDTADQIKVGERLKGDCKSFCVSAVVKHSPTSGLQTRS